MEAVRTAAVGKDLKDISFKSANTVEGKQQ